MHIVWQVHNPSFQAAQDQRFASDVEVTHVLRFTVTRSGRGLTLFN